MRFERISNKAIILFELITVIGFGLLTWLILFAFLPGTWLWYLLLWLDGAAFVLVAFLYIPIAYLNIEYGINNDVIIYRKGVFFPNTQILYRDRVAFVTVYENPLTPFLKISTLIVSAAGGNIRIFFINSDRADEIAKMFSKAKPKKPQAKGSR